MQLPSATTQRPDIAVFYGTRPQLVKASKLVSALRTQAKVLAIDTGQHYDYELNGLLYEQLAVQPADLFLEVGSGTHAKQTAEIIQRAAVVLDDYRPKRVAVIGDTNSTLGAALAATKLRIPVVHVEAGLRASDPLMAEEINRRIVDAISGLLCAPSRAAEATLLRESVSGRVVMTGDIARDVLISNLARAPQTEAIARWPLVEGEPFVFCTLHRAELTDDREALHAVLRSLDRLPIPVIMAVHPRTRAKINEIGIKPISALLLREPFGYLETVACIREAVAVVTDSGGVQRESYWLGTPCITVRHETEWPETVQCGANVLIPPRQVDAELHTVLANSAAGPRDWPRDAYGDGHAAEAITVATMEWLGKSTHTMTPTL